jgi:recombinational DNA repair protein (RecF pathway)
VAIIDDEALVLDHHPFRDRHLILAVLTHHHGVQRGVLRRARGGKAPPAAAAQILSLIQVSLYQKATADLATFRHIDLLTSSFPLASDLARSTASAVVAELLLTFCPPGEPAERSFRLGVSCLDALLEGKEADTVVSYAEFWSLALGGVLPPPEAIATALGERGQVFLVSCRRQPVREAPSAVPQDAAGWLDQRVREEAERPMRALSFYRELAE